MKSYGEIRKEVAQVTKPQIRTDYRCRAHGCPNAASMDGDVCYWHWEADTEQWPAVTERINANFATMRNWTPT